MSQSSNLKSVTVFVEHFPPYLGSDKTIFELATRMADRGVRVHFIATQPLRYLVGERPANWKYKENWTREPKEIHKNISVKYLLLEKRIENLWRRFAPLAYFITLILFTIWSLREVIRMKPNVVVSAHASPIVGVVALISAKLTFRPLVMGCPDWMSAYAAGLMSESMNSLGPVLLQLIETRLYKWVNQIIAATTYLKTVLVRYGIPSDRITVISNGVDPTVFSPDIDVSEIRRKYRLENRTVLLFTGHLEEWAGISLIYDLAKRLDSEVSNAHILLVGTGATVGELMDKLVRENLSHTLTYAGLQPFEDMPKFNAVANIALCIFPNTLTSHAASPLKLFEYMSSGLAIVATKVSGTEEALDERAGILVSPENSTEICDAVVQLCNNPSLVINLGEKARKLAEQKFSWDSLANDFYQVCLDVTNHHA